MGMATSEQLDSADLSAAVHVSADGGQSGTTVTRAGAAAAPDVDSTDASESVIAHEPVTNAAHAVDIIIADEWCDIPNSHWLV
jgi:hypothetical protein